MFNIQSFLYCRIFLLQKGFFLAIILLSVSQCFAQKYTFTHYDIEDGLIESQVNKISSDNQHRLWLATDGGACRFDGSEYTSFTRQNGIQSNFVNNIYAAQNGMVWFGTQNGLNCLNGQRITNYGTSVKLKNHRVTSIVEDSSGTIWFLMGRHLFRVDGATSHEVLLPDTNTLPLTCLASDRKGKLFAAVYRKGIFNLDNGKWIKIGNLPYENPKIIISKILFDNTDKEKLYLLSVDDIYTLKNKQLQIYEPQMVHTIKSPLFALEQENDGTLWIGTINGAYRIKEGQLMHFVSANGLTDNAITDIYLDADNNLWFGSQGSGFYKFEGDRVLTIDKSQGLAGSEIVMSIVKDRDNKVVFGIDGGGLVRYDGKKLTPLNLPGANSMANKVQCLYTDTKGNIWIGTNGGGLWVYDSLTFRLIKGSDRYSINHITQDAQGTIWLALPSGAYFVKDNALQRVDDFATFCSAAVALGRDSVIVGTQDGISLLVNKKKTPFKLNAMGVSAVLCLLEHHGMLIIGTDDRGVFTWNRKTGEVKNYTMKDGLNSNTIYSLVFDNHNVLWMGNGRGVNKMMYNHTKREFETLPGEGSKQRILESNQGAALYFDHRVWIGTTRGLVIYISDPVPVRLSPPHIIIQSVKLVRQLGDSLALVSNGLNDGTSLPYNRSHISISFLGIHLKSPESISYRYQLIGLDSAFSAPVKNNMVDYPSLPAGNYTFEVKAVNNEGVVSNETARFSFSITPPFYQTATFRLFAILLFILLGNGLQSYFHHIKVKRQKIIEATKLEENLKIRQQTAEDFHDELGNKLTRITVLSQLLDTKMDKTHPDQKKLLEQIKQNAASLYSGTKDILWALDPQSDNLYEILNHIKDFGNELFLDTDVAFEFNGIDEALSAVKLPMEYSRNLPMIFKELLNNILKHASASQVTINMNNSKKDELILSIADNGQGFDPEAVRKGQGINNITTRTARIGGTVNFYSANGKGTLITLTIKLNR